MNGTVLAGTNNVFEVECDDGIKIEINVPENNQKYTISNSRWLFPIIINEPNITDHAHTPIGRCSDGPLDSQGQAASLQ